MVVYGLMIIIICLLFALRLLIIVRAAHEIGQFDAQRCEFLVFEFINVGISRSIFEPNYSIFMYVGVHMYLNLYPYVGLYPVFVLEIGDPKIHNNMSNNQQPTMSKAR